MKKANNNVALEKREKIKMIIKRIFVNKYSFTVLYFFFIYLATDFLNNFSYREIFTKGIPNNEFWKYFWEATKYIFGPMKILCNMTLYMAAYFVINSVLNKTRLSCLIISFFSMMFAIANYAIIDLRGAALTLADVYSLKTALNVSKGIVVSMDLFFVAGFILYVIANVFLCRSSKFDEYEIGTKKLVRVILLVVSIAWFSFLFMHEPLMKTVKLWNSNLTYKYNGAGLTVIKMLREGTKLDAPEGYVDYMVKDKLDEYEHLVTSGENSYPNIIAVMNESFSDLYSVYNIEMSGDNLPFFRELMQRENVVSGITHSSTYASGTSNCEYEFLTQNSTAYLPTGSATYQQYIMDDVEDSIVNTLNKLNYNTYGMHSWYKSGYSREKVYKYFGFKNQAFEETMEGLEYGPSGYSTDSSTYKQWYNIMDNKPSGESNFSLIVTMQNHSPYTDELPSGEQYVSGDKKTNAYLQRVKMSDDALRELIEYIDNYEEDTILLFFGDHQPACKQSVTYSSKEERDYIEVKYIVPFFIYANYDIKEESGIETSTNYLQNILLEVAGIPLNEYANYIKELRSSIPVISANYYIGADGVRYNLNDESAPYYNLIKEYEKMVYYQLFGDKNVQSGEIDKEN